MQKRYIFACGLELWCRNSQIPAICTEIVSEGKPYFDVLCVCGVYAYTFVFTSVLPYIIYTTTNFLYPNIDTLIRRSFQSSWVF